jgi:hypothetical protein
MKVILGGGIAGLIFAYYNKDYLLLTDHVGGQMSSYFDLGPRYLHKTSKVVEFLNRLKMPIIDRKIKVGYLSDNGFEEPTELFRELYFKKSRCVNDLKGFDPTVLNTNLREFDVLDVDFKDLVGKLFNKLDLRIYTTKVVSIDIDKCLVTTSNTQTFRYEHLVSTIPLNIFCKISNLSVPVSLESFDMTYCLLKNTFFEMGQFDFIYDIRTTTCFHRMTKCKQGIVCDLHESRLKELNSISDVFFSLPKKYSIQTIKNSQIISLEKDFELKNNRTIKFFGRYGTWNRRFKTETVIEEAQCSN